MAAWLCRSQAIVGLTKCALTQDVIQFGVVTSHIQIREKHTTPKRRRTYPLYWWAPRKRKVYLQDHITGENIQFLNEVAKVKYLQPGESPLREEPWEKKEWTPQSKRCGVIARKIGIYPMWDKNGKRLLTTLLQVVDNHVVRYVPPEEHEKWMFGEKYKGLGALVVGAESADPSLFNDGYLEIFKKSGVMPKKKLTKFMITPDGAVQPGTPLFASHFRVGDHVNVLGKTIGHGFQGVIKRWGMKGGPATHGCTKAHRRMGAMGGPRGIILKGKKMPGHMGQERRLLVGLKIWRINTKHNVIWVHGPAVPGWVNAYVSIYDCYMDKKKHSVENPPPFPTYYPDHEHSLPEEIYDKDLHRFDAPSIMYEEEEEGVKKKAKVKTKLKGKK